jgi:hypothetical protein
MSHVLDLQTQESEQQARVWSTWSLVGCASTFSVGLC